MLYTYMFIEEMKNFSRGLFTELEPIETKPLWFVKKKKKKK